MEFKRTMKGSVPIRTLVIAGVVVLTYIFALTGFIGNYSLNNNLPLNATLRAQYQTIYGNSTNVGVYGNLTNLSSQASAQSSQLGSVSTPNYIGLASRYLLSIPALYGAIAYLVASPLQSMGLPVTQALANILLLVIIIVVLAILSALFLFPITYIPEGEDQ